MHILHYTTIYIYIYIYMCVNHFAVQQKLAEHCKSTILQFKNNCSLSFPLHWACGKMSHLCHW